MASDAERVQESIRKLRRLLKKTSRRPSPEEIHDLRTQSRRFEATVDALGLESKRNERRALRDLSRVRRRAGKVRDMDVLTGYTSTVHVEEDEDCLVQLLEHLGAQRYRHADRLRGVVQKYGPGLRSRLKRSMARFEKLIPDRKQGQANNGSRAPAEVVATTLRLSRELAAPETLNKKNLHPYRLKVKELRYVLQLADEPRNEKFVDMLGEVKDAVGEWHDWEELIAIADEVLDHGAQCKVLHKLKEITGQKYERALSLTNKMRREYLHVGGIKKGAPDGRATLRPVLEAASAIAS